MASSIHRITSRFLAIGGRFMIDPADALAIGIDVPRLYAIGIPPTERRRRLRRAKAASRLIAQRGPQVAALIRQHGRPVSGWSVWEGR